MKVGKIYTFEAAHHLPNHNGKCRNPHGHSYRLEVEVEGTVVREEKASYDGMVLDFSTLDSHVDPVIHALDHTDLNKVLSLTTTAENILSFIWSELMRATPVLNYSRLRLWETAKGYAEWP